MMRKTWKSAVSKREHATLFYSGSADVSAAERYAKLEKMVDKAVSSKIDQMLLRELGADGAKVG